MGDPITTCAEIAVEMLNNSDPAAALGAISSSSEFLKNGEFNRVLILADMKRARLICENPKDGARAVFLTGTQNGIANGAILSAMVGQVETIQMVVSGGRWAGTHHGTNPQGASIDDALRELSIENRNVTANPEIAPHFVQVNQSIFHNAVGMVLGGAASVSVNAVYATFSTNFSATALQCPSQWTRSIVADGLAMQFGKDGQKTAAAAYFARISQEEAPVQ